MPTHWSYSAWKNYQECAYRYFLERVEKLAVPIRIASVAGTAMHSAADQWDHGNTEVSWAEVFEATIQEEEESSGIARDYWLVSNQGTETFDWWAENGPPMLERWKSWRTGHSEFEIASGLPADRNGNVQGVEYALKVEIDGIEFVGYVDRLFTKGDDLVDVDIKAGRPRGAVEQLKFYQAMGQAAGLANLRYGAIWKAREGKLGRVYELGYFTPADLVEQVSEAHAGRERGDFPASPGWQCGWCLVRPYCKFAE